MENEEYCSFEVAKLLKEKGFDWDCETSYYISNEGCESAVSVGDFTKVRPWREALIAAPTHQMAMSWFRKKHNIHIDIVSIWNQNRWEYQVFIITPTTSESPYVDNTLYMGYEEAVEAALKYVLEYLV